MKVCIAEKPGVARDIAKVLGANTRNDGYFSGNGYAVTWTYGHLCSLKEPADYSEDWKQWRMSYLPMIPARFGIKPLANDGAEKQLKVISRLFAEADEIINCGDAGQEGELIQRWVLQYSKVKGKPVKRLWISSLTEEAIKEGFENLRDSSDFDRLYAAGCTRAIGDWLLGLNATRLYTLKYSRGKGVLSVGRVQTPTLALVVKRQDEIENFKPMPYWEIKTLYRGAEFQLKKGRFDKKEDAEALLSKLKDSPLEIKSVKEGKGSEKPPKLFDLTSLQVECNKKFAYTAEQTLGLIQSLYEKKLCTYPRVDTCYLSDDIYPKVPGILRGLKPYAAFTEPLLREAKLPKRKEVFDDKKVTDHHAIIPTGTFNNSFAGVEEKKVYDLIARRFIAAFYPDCRYAATTVEAEAAGAEFKAAGRKILSEGWRVLYPRKKDGGDADSKDEQLLPAFTPGESGPHEPSLAEKTTQPPKYYTEATLLRAMETAGKNVEDESLREALKENGLGRPSTRASIIETLFKRGYIARDKKRISATETGRRLIATISNDLLKSAELTGQWERKMREIERGNYDAGTLMEEIKVMVGRIVEEVRG